MRYSKEKNKQYHDTYYKKHKKLIRQRVTRRRIKISAWFRDFKKTLCCSRCSESHPACLHFHHVNAHEKEIGITTAAYSNSWSIERLRKEISKCIVLCANCHAKEHYKDNALLAELADASDSKPDALTGI